MILGYNVEPPGKISSGIRRQVITFRWQLHMASHRLGIHRIPENDRKSEILRSHNGQNDPTQSAPGHFLRGSSCHASAVRGLSAFRIGSEVGGDDNFAGKGSLATDFERPYPRKSSCFHCLRALFAVHSTPQIRCPSKAATKQRSVHKSGKRDKKLYCAVLFHRSEQSPTRSTLVVILLIQYTTLWAHDKLGPARYYTLQCTLALGPS